jgi:hypothetical protein
VKWSGVKWRPPPVAAECCGPPTRQLDLGLP